MSDVSSKLWTGMLSILLTFTGALPAQDVRDGEALVLAGGTVFPSPEVDPIVDGVVVVRDGVIVAVGSRGTVTVPAGATILDCSDRTVAAGFWNCHVHFFERKWARAEELPADELTRQLRDMLTRYGFTSVFDLGSPGANTRRIRHRIERGEILGPRILTTGEPLMGPGWMPPASLLSTLGFLIFPSPEVTNGEQATAAARDLLASGADGLKLFTASPAPPHGLLSTEAIRAAVEEAHRRKKLVFAHPSSPAGVSVAVQGGVDIIAHTTPGTGAWDTALIHEMREAGVAVIPTLKIWKYHLRHDRASLGEAAAREGVAQLRAWLEVNGEVLFGTDVGGIDDADPSEEYLLMAAAGMTFRQVLAALTTVPANRFGDAKRGRIAPGFVADLVVLGGDPSRDIRVLAAVETTVRDGKILYRAPE